MIQIVKKSLNLIKLKSPYFVYFLMGLFFAAIFKFIEDFGPFYSTDTINYLAMAKTVTNGFFPQSPCFSPGFPFFLSCISFIAPITEATAIYPSFYIIFFLSFVAIHFLVKLTLSNEKKSFFTLIIFSFLIISHFGVIKILMSAHADALFLLCLLIFFIFIYLWLSTFSIKWFILTSIWGSLCLWFKYNGLLLTPFLIISTLIFGQKKYKNYILFLPLFFVSVSYLTFKKINGNVITHFQGAMAFEKLKLALVNYKLGYSNFIDSGKIFFGALFTKPIEMRIPDFLGFVFMIFLKMMQT